MSTAPQETGGKPTPPPVGEPLQVPDTTDVRSPTAAQPATPPDTELPTGVPSPSHEDEPTSPPDPQFPTSELYTGSERQASSTTTLEPRSEEISIQVISGLDSHGSRPGKAPSIHVVPVQSHLEEDSPEPKPKPAWRKWLAEICYCVVSLLSLISGQFLLVVQYVADRQSSLPFYAPMKTKLCPRCLWISPSTPSWLFSPRVPRLPLWLP